MRKFLSLRRLSFTAHQSARCAGYPGRMTSPREYKKQLIHLVGVAAGAGMLLSATPAWAADTASTLSVPAAAFSSSPGVSVLAEAPAYYKHNVVDEAGVLSPQQKAQLEEKLHSYKLEHHKSIFVVFVKDFGGQSAKEWTKEANRINGGTDVAIFAVSPELRDAGLYTGESWSTSERDHMWNAAYDHLVNSDWAGAANAVIDEASTSGQMSPESKGWLAAGGGAVAVTGAGAWALSKRRRKRIDQKTLEQSRAIDPGDSDSLLRLPIETLDKRASEELVSTDESIRRGREELDLAVSEFGPERTRSFTKAMNHSTTTLQRAFELRRRYDDGPELPEEQQRELLVDIVSSCGMADAALDAEAENFANLRNLLVNAPDRLAQMTQQVVDLRTRLPKAKQRLSELHQQYAETMIGSIAHNDVLAAGAIDEADTALSEGHRLEKLPAGEQGALVDAIRAGEHAITTADKLLSAIEHADENIRVAEDNVGGLITEVNDEIRELKQLIERGRAQGLREDWAKLQEKTQSYIEQAKAASDKAQSDPLGAYGELTDLDADLDATLDKLREANTTKERLLKLFDQQMRSAGAKIEAAEDLISSRGQIVRGQARTKLAEAQRAFAEALQLRITDTRRGIEHARRAARTAEQARKLAEHDIDQYRRQVNAQQGGNGSGGLLTGLVLGEILSSGNRSSGFGGGFGGGGFGGGGGGFSGGRF